MQWPASIPQNPTIIHPHGYAVAPLPPSAVHTPPQATGGSVPLSCQHGSTFESITASTSETSCQWKGSPLHAINLYCTLSSRPFPNGQQSSAVLGRTEFSHRVKTPDTLEFAFIYWPLLAFVAPTWEPRSRFLALTSLVSVVDASSEGPFGAALISSHSPTASILVS